MSNSLEKNRSPTKGSSHGIEIGWVVIGRCRDVGLRKETPPHEDSSGAWFEDTLRLSREYVYVSVRVCVCLCLCLCVHATLMLLD